MTIVYTSESPWPKCKHGNEIRDECEQCANHFCDIEGCWE